MKKIGLLLVLVAIVVSCKKDALNGDVILSGKIKNKGINELSIRQINGLESNVIEIKEDGSFSSTIFVENGVYQLIYGRNRVELYLEGKKNLNIDFDVRDFENSLVFSGDGGAACTYASKKGKILKTLQKDDRKMYELSESEFKNKLNEIKKSLEDVLNSTDGISSNFKAKEKRNLNYFYLNKLGNYGTYHSFMIKDPSFNVSKGFLDELKDLKYDSEEDFIFSSEYRNLLTSYYRKKSFELLATTPMKIEQAYIQTIAAITNETIKNGLLLDYSNTMMSSVKDKENFYKAIIAASSNEDNNRIFTDSFNQFQTISKGKPSPLFDNYENEDGSIVSLKNLKGKFVYIYVWSSTFSPSKEDLKDYIELQNKFKNDKIVFVTISVDKLAKKDIWKETLAKEGIKGINLIADNGRDSEFIKKYQILFPPKFILIDADGNIIDADAPKPSNKKLIELFKEHNI